MISSAIFDKSGWVKFSKAICSLVQDKSKCIKAR